MSGKDPIHPYFHSPIHSIPPTRKYVKLFFPRQAVGYVLQDGSKMEARLLSRICFIYCITWGRNSSMAYQLFVFRLSLKRELAAYLHCHSEIYSSGCLSIAGPWHFPWGGWQLSSHVTPPSVSMTRAAARHVSNPWAEGEAVGWLIYPPQPEMRSDGSGS